MRAHELRRYPALELRSDDESAEREPCREQGDTKHFSTEWLGEFMQPVYEARVAEAREIERQFRQGTDKIVSRKFGAVAKVLWPFKTAAQLAVIGGTNERTAARWLAGEFEPPAIVIAAIIVEITKRS